MADTPLASLPHASAFDGAERLTIHDPKRTSGDRSAYMLPSDVVSTGLADGLKILEGSNATMGRATLVGGTVTVNTTKATTTMEVFLTSRVPGGTPSFLSVGTVVAGTSFVINSANVLDTSDVSWLIVEPA